MYPQDERLGSTSHEHIRHQMCWSRRRRRRSESWLCRAGLVRWRPRRRQAFVGRLPQLRALLQWPRELLPEGRVYWTRRNWHVPAVHHLPGALHEQDTRGCVGRGGRPDHVLCQYHAQSVDRGWVEVGRLGCFPWRRWWRGHPGHPACEVRPSERTFA